MFQYIILSGNKIKNCVSVRRTKEQNRRPFLFSKFDFSEFAKSKSSKIGGNFEQNAAHPFTIALAKFSVLVNVPDNDPANGFIDCQSITPPSSDIFFFVFVFDSTLWILLCERNQLISFLDILSAFDSVSFY